MTDADLVRTWLRSVLAGNSISHRTGSLAVEMGFGVIKISEAAARVLLDDPITNGESEQKR